MNKNRIILLFAISAILSSCGIVEEMSKDSPSDAWTFGEDLAFFAKHEGACVVLGEGESFIVASAKWQGRVLTSTLSGESGTGLGWYNRYLLDSKKTETYSNPLGGEDVFAIGPEGGDASIYFTSGTLYSSDNWKAPEFISNQPWKLVAKTDTQAKFEKDAQFENSKGTVFKIKAEREISFINRKETETILGLEIPNTVKTVAYQSLNKLTNTGNTPWDEKSGMLNIAVKSSYHANDTTVVCIPYKSGDNPEMGDILKSDNIAGGAIPIFSVEKDFIKMDVHAKRLENIGINAQRSKGIMISYDSNNNLLTVVTYMRPSSARGYLSSSFRRVDAGGQGDAISVFNNGPAEQGAFYAMPFYQVSTYSPALLLPAGKTQFHLQRTFHFSGSEYELGVIAYKLTGISMKNIRGDE